MNAVIEQRPMAEAPEFRSAENGRRIVAAGIAMRYGTRSKPIPHASKGVFREEFRSGALAKSISEQDVKAHLEHHGPFLARTGSGTMRLTDDRSVVAYEIDLPDTTAGRDAAALLERRDLAGSSIGFRSIPAEEKWSVEDGMALRSVGQAQLFVVDLTVSPAYPESTAEMALRSLANELGCEVRALLEAPDLSQMIAPADAGDEGDEEEEHGRETPTVHRRPLASLYL